MFLPVKWAVTVPLSMRHVRNILKPSEGTEWNMTDARDRRCCCWIP